MYFSILLTHAPALRTPPLREDAQAISTTPPTACAVTSPFVGEIEIGLGKGVQFLSHTPPPCGHPL